MKNNLQNIDLSQLNSMAGGDEIFKKELIRIFLDQIPEFIKNMNHFFENNILDKLAREAHTAKSSVLIFGMTNTGQVLKDIELLAESKKSEGIESMLKQVGLELNQAVADLQSLLNEEKS